MVSSPFSSVTTTGRFFTMPAPRMPTCGCTMIGVSNSAPLLPRLVSENVPPASSSGVTLFARALAARSAILCARPARLRSPALWITALSRPRSVSMAMPRCSAAW